MEVSKRGKKTDYAVLNEVFEGKLYDWELTDHQQEKYKIVKACYAHLLAAKSTFKIVKRLQNDFGLSQAQAYRDLSLTEKLYGKVRESNKAMKRQIAENMAMTAYRMALKQKDAKAVAAAAKVYIEATGCNIDDPEMPDFNKIKPSINIITVSEDVLKKVTGNMTIGPVVRKHEDYAEYTEITEDAQ